MRKKHITWQWLSAAIISLLMFSAPALAGSLNPSAPPAPTMKTLDQAPAKDEVIPPWSQTLPANDTGDPCNSARFKCVMGGEAVLDKETGLVWEQSSGTGTYIWTWDSWNWSGNIAQFQCNDKTVGGRKGWRLPTPQELISLVDTSVSGIPKLPSGHPFSNVQPTYYWSATTVASNTNYAWVVNVSFGFMYIRDKTWPAYVWCVRGGQGVGVDAQ
ncbi:MAG: DUF1566 domain-containing protein [Nitrospirae bacterium]|nr:DUF1566 domain-containing protein [Nitrospirota bacterium]